MFLLVHIKERIVSMKQMVKNRRIVIGDIHGELDGLQQILQNAGLMDANNKWIGNDSILIQTGDVIDRGPHSLECIALLRSLQKEAPKGAVVRLFGNHELMALQHDWRYVNFSDPDAYVRELKIEISEGNVLASYTDGERLYTHAGLRSAIRESLLKEILASKPDTAKGKIDLFMLSDHINTVFKEAVAGDELERHPIFHVDSSRGGHDPVGGIFWCDYSSINPSIEAWSIPQIFGHTPTWENAVKTSHGLKLIDIDAGMCHVYGGNRVYLEITAEGQLVQHSKAEGKWTSTPLEA